LKKSINKSAIITKNKVISINQLNYKAPEKPHVPEELVGYTISKEKIVFTKHNSVLQSELIR